jgi:hypothetical protein
MVNLLSKLTSNSSSEILCVFIHMHLEDDLDQVGKEWET